MARTKGDYFLGSKAWHMDTRIYESMMHGYSKALSLVGRYNGVGDGTNITHSTAPIQGPSHFPNPLRYCTVYIRTDWYYTSRGPKKLPSYHRLWHCVTMSGGTVELDRAEGWLLICISSPAAICHAMWQWNAHTPALSEMSDRLMTSPSKAGGRNG